MVDRKAGATKQAPNVKLGKDAQPFAVGDIQVGGLETPLTLPSLDAQRKGFYLPPVELSLLLRLAGDRYKRVESLG